jgi:deferrochelatase/peroxidase EfeB
MSVMIETNDVQGLVVRGYGKHHAARFLVLAIKDVTLARHYLQTISGQINTAAAKAESFVRQIAFTAPGLKRLGIPPTALASFSREFLEGMDDDVRAVALGDEGDNDPTKWEWGHTAENVHALLMLYALDEDTLKPYLAKELADLSAGFDVTEKDTITLDDNKEHFGWKDGLSMPVFDGVPPMPGKQTAGKPQETWTTPLAPGEFVLGYPNEYECFTEIPTVDLVDDPTNQLPFTTDGSKKALGRNGTYLIYREMTQHVHDLWKYLADNSIEPGADTAGKAIALGAKMVGRWPGGAPLMTSPDRDDSQRVHDNKFLYSKDLKGLACPLGSHIRRANPRDQLAADRDTHDSEIMVRKHQMIRRGRSFGPPISPTMSPREILEKAPDQERRGLHFICLVGHISRQFEFVQRAWIHSANFGGLFKDGDPISAARRPSIQPNKTAGDNPNDEFTCPATPVRRKYTAMPKFTTLVGGAYFFLPSITALRFIAQDR